MEYFLENRTLLIQGSEFLVGFPSDHKIYLSQANGAHRSTYCTTTLVTTSTLSCQLTDDDDSQPLDGAIFASVVAFDGGISAEKLIGYYSRVSVFSQYEVPSGVDIQASPKLQFRLSSAGINSPPNWATSGSAISLISAFADIPPAHIYARFSLISIKNSSYDLELFFFTSVAASAFSGLSLPSNLTLIAEVAVAIRQSTNDTYAASLLFASTSIDPLWPFLVYQLTPTNTSQPSPLGKSELTAIRSISAALWDLPPSAVFSAIRPAQTGAGYEMTLYFQTAAAGIIFVQYQLPLNATAIGAGVGAIVSAATSGSYSSRFLRSSPFTKPAQDIDVSWPWIKFLLLGSSDSVVLQASAKDVFLSEAALIFHTNSSDLVCQLEDHTTSKKRVVNTELTIFFATNVSQAAFFAMNTPFNDTLLASISSMVVRTSNSTVNSTYIGSNIVAPQSAAVVPQPTGLSTGVILAIAIPIVAVALILIAVGAIFFRRRSLLLRRLKAEVEQLPEELRSVISIKSSDLVVGKKLGEGSFGAVFKATYKAEKVALKKLSAGMMASHVADFFREASVMLSIKPHPNIVRMIGMCQELNSFSMVMEYCSGGDLDGFVREEIQAEGRVNEKALYYLARGIALGMRHLAAGGIVHRDLAARNILLDEKDVPKISDFGFSRVVSGEEAKGKTQTTVGPIRWMAPENIKSLEYSEKSDVWSYGGLLIEMVTGDMPFPGQDLVAVAVKVRDGSATALDFVAKDTIIPRWMLELIRLCFTYNERERPSFNDVLHYLNSHAPHGVTVHDDEERARRGTIRSAASVSARKRAKSQRKSRAFDPDDPTADRYAEMETVKHRNETNSRESK